LEEDKSALSGLFPCVTISRNGVDRCDVLFLYAHFSADGKIEGADASLREIIHAAGAKIVVVASANSSSSYTNPARSREFVRANLVLTTDRRGECFPRFCSSLFSKMKSGLPMTTAWTAVAPQGLESEHRDLPFTIFLCELGALRFKYGALRG
jgi:hypothetical protein